VLNDATTLSWLIPEILLIVVATLLLVGGAFRRAPRLWLGIALAGYTAAAAAMIVGELPRWREAEPPVLSGPLISDALGFLLRLLSLLAGALFTLIAAHRWKHRQHSEIVGLLMLLTTGGMLVARANELVFLFLGLELVSIPTYVLLFLGRHDRASGEATAKYFFLSVFSSALLLYGLSFLYGAAGTTSLTGPVGMTSIAATLQAGPATFAALGLALVIAGLGFKIAAAPFHFYAPDVYQGTTAANAAVLAVVPKIAGMAALVRLVVVACGGLADFAWQIALVIAVLTMTVGNVCALWQQNVRRLLAYSSIAHAGYMLIGIAVGAVPGRLDAAFGGTAAMLFYLCVYSLAVIGLFALLAYLGDDQRRVESVDSLAGLATTRPWAAALLALFLFSLAGIPPLAGFWGKLTLFMSALGVALSDPAGAGGGLPRWFLALAIIGALNAAIAAAYYLRLVAVMYFRPPPTAAPIERLGRSPAAVAAAICAVLVVMLGLRQGLLSGLSGRADAQLRAQARGGHVLSAEIRQEPAGMARDSGSP
jgi:NADH-quinone oxidoreductase subunit N